MGADVATMSRMAGLGELAGLSSLAVGRDLDRGRERRWLVGGLLVVVVGCALSPVGANPAMFGLGFALTSAGVAAFTTSGQTWIGERVSFERRARSIGIYETAWAVALLVVAPVAAVLVGWVAWWTPFVVLAAANLMVAMVLARAFPADRPHRAATRTPLRLPANGWAVLVTSWAIALASMCIFVSYGAWLEDDFGFPVGAIGVVSVLGALVELAGSSLTALRSDRWGKHRAVRVGLVIMLVALVLLPLTGGRTVIGVLVLVAFLGSFEFAFVSNIALVTEVAVSSRGAVVGLNNAVGTAARAAGVALGGAAYATWGMAGVVSVSGTAAVVALAAATLAARDRQAPAQPSAPSGSMG